jgi:hypothetical protein
MCEYAVRQFAEAPPHEFFSQSLPIRGPHGRQHNQGPTAGPIGRGSPIDAHGGVGKSLAAGLGQAVFGEFAVAPRLDPAFLRQAGGGGAHQALVEPKWNGEPDQPAQRDRTSARHDGIAEDRDDERSGALRALAAKAREQFVGGGGGVDGHFPQDCNMPRDMTQKKLH